MQGTELLVALALADHANDNGEAIEGGVRYLAWKTGTAERSLRRYLSAFRDKGWLEIVSAPAPGRATCYRLHLNKLPAKEKYSSAANMATERRPDGGHTLAAHTHTYINNMKGQNGHRAAHEGQHGHRQATPANVAADGESIEHWLSRPDSQLNPAEKAAREHYLKLKAKREKTLTATRREPEKNSESAKRN